jgi:hypothetical protein
MTIKEDMLAPIIFQQRKHGESDFTINTIKDIEELFSYDDGTQSDLNRRLIEKIEELERQIGEIK